MNSSSALVSASTLLASGGLAQAGETFQCAGLNVSPCFGGILKGFEGFEFGCK